MRIQSNMMALNALNHRKKAESGAAKQTSRLASGSRIRIAADDAAGLSISEKMRAQIRGLRVAVRNARDASSNIQSREGTLNEVHDMSQRMRELAVQALNDTLTDQDRGEVQSEFRALQEALGEILGNSEFNTKPLFEEHEAAYYKFGGNTDLTSPVKIIEGLNNDLQISVDGSVFEITIPAGTYPPEELIDLIDTELMEVHPGLIVNLDSDNKTSLQVENGFTIDYIQGGLSFVFYEYVTGTPPGMIVGVTEFQPDGKLLIQPGDNDVLTFFVGSEEFTVKFFPKVGGYDIDELIDIINNQLEGEGQTDVEAVKYSNMHIALKSDKYVITGLSGNMIKLDGITSVLYDNAKYGTVQRTRGYYTGARDFSGSGSVEITKNENDVLRIKLNGASDYVELSLLQDDEPNKTFNLEELVARINLMAEEQGVGVTASTSGSALRIYSNFYGADSQVEFDTNQTYIDLFTRPYTPALYTGYNPSIFGYMSLDEYTIIRQDKNDQLKLTVDDQDLSIKLDAGVYSRDALVSLLNSKLEEALWEELPKVSARSSGTTLYVDVEASGDHSISVDKNSTAFRSLLEPKQPLSPPVRYKPGKTIWPPEGTVGPPIDFEPAVLEGLVDLSRGEIYIEEDINDTLSFKVNDEMYAIVLPNGDYDADSLLREIKSQIDGAHVLVSLNDDNHLVFTTVGQGDGNEITDVGGSAYSTILVGKSSSYGRTSEVAETSRLYRYKSSDEVFHIDTSNNHLTFVYEKDGTSHNISVTIKTGEYTAEALGIALEEAIQDFLRKEIELSGKEIEVEVSTNAMQIKSATAGGSYQLRSFSGSFYEKVLCDENRRSHGYHIRGTSTGSDKEQAYIVGRHDLDAETVIHPYVNDLLIFDFAFGSAKETFELRLDGGAYDRGALIAEIQNKLDEQLSDKGLEPGFLKVQIGGVETGTEVSDTNKLVIKFETPSDGKYYNGEYIIDGVRGSAAYSIFYKSEGDPTPSHVVGVLDMSQGAKISAGVNDTFVIDINGETKTVVLPQGNYPPEDLLEVINEEFKGQSLGIIASYFDNRLKLSFEEPGANTLDKIRGNAVGTLFFEVSSRKEQVPDHFHVGANSGNSLAVDQSRLSPELLRINTITIRSGGSAEKALARLDNAIQKISSERSRLGALQNRLDSVIRNNGNYAENLLTSESRIRDADVAQEVLEQVKHQIVMQSSTAMLVQANQQPQRVLELLS